jgi:hypothetical protein
VNGHVFEPDIDYVRACARAASAKKVRAVVGNSFTGARGFQENDGNYFNASHLVDAILKLLLREQINRAIRSILWESVYLTTA